MADKNWYTSSEETLVELKNEIVVIVDELEAELIAEKELNAVS